MTREILVYRDGQMVDKASVPPRTGHHIISDTLNDVWCPSDGKRYSSKSAYYRAVKANGGEIMGNDNSLRERPKVNIERPQESIKRIAQQRGWDL